MNFNEHSELKGLHAFLSASKYHWINYDEEKLKERYENSLAVQRGNELHEFAQLAISHGIKLQRSQRTLNMYVNDAIGYHMKPEQVLFYSVNCFGTADAIAFSEKKKFLRIHDLKTGDTPASVHQLEIYDALFCLEYGYNPFEIEHELRIYQSNEVFIHNPDPKDITKIEDKIITFDKCIEKIKQEI